MVQESLPTWPPPLADPSAQASLAVSDSGALSRRARGAYYTPCALAAYVVGEALRGSAARTGNRGVVLDPACGDGALLSEALRTICSQDGVAADAFATRLQLAQRHLFGVDRDAEAVEQAIRVVSAEVAGGLRSERAAAAADALRGNFAVGDSLLTALEDLLPRLMTSRVGDTNAKGAVDVVLANPPFVNIRRLGQLYNEEARLRLRREFRSASGNFDLYVLFIERALRWLRPGGRAAFITPNKFATLRYAENCRRLLLEQAELESVLDASSIRLFSGAEVYPFVWVFRKRAELMPDSGKAPTSSGSSEPEASVNGTAFIQVKRVASPNDLRSPQLTARLHQDALSPIGFVLQEDLDIERRGPTRPLGELCSIHSGSSGYTAQRLLAHLHESDAIDAGDDGWPFIVSGNIDRYRIRAGNVRYLRTQFVDPRLSSACPLSPQKRRLYGEPKIVIAGMGRHLEAAWDDQGYALGVQVYAMRDIQDLGFGEEQHLASNYLLGLLNARLMTRLFQIRFSAKQLADGYLSINKSQLEQLPIAQPKDPAGRGVQREIAMAAARLREPGLPCAERSGLEARMNGLVYSLYCLSREEVAEIEQDAA